MPAVKKIRNATNILMELRKICQHPYLSAPEMENEADPEEKQHKELAQSCGKLAFLKLLLPKLKAKGHRVLLFSQFKIALDRIQDFLYGEGYSFLRLDGDAPQAQRQKDMDAFNAPDSEFFIFLLTTRAGGVGINLATADTVIVYDPDFNPHQDLQAIARSHRYGQNKKVLVFKLMTKDSVEEQIIQKGKQKMVLDHLVVQNLGKDGGEEADVDSMLLHGAKALYETNADGTSATDITYTSKQVDEMIDKVEKQADEEAKVMQAKWDKEDAMTEEEKLHAQQNRPAETMDFSFAKIWETERADLQEVEAAAEEDDDEMQVDLQMIRTAAEESRERERVRELERDRKDRRKNQQVNYKIGHQDDSPKKKIHGNTKKRKPESAVVSSQGSDAEFRIDAQEEISAFDSDDMGLDAVPEHYPDLDNLPDNRGAEFRGLSRQVKELRKMERRAIKKRQAALAEQASRESAMNVEGPHTAGGMPPRLPTPPSNDVALGVLEGRALKAQKQEERVKTERRRLEKQMQELIENAERARQQAPAEAEGQAGPSVPAPTLAQFQAQIPPTPISAASNAIAGPSKPAQAAQTHPPTQQWPVAGPSRITHPPQPPAGSGQQRPESSSRPPTNLVDAARIGKDIIEARDAFQRMWHDLCRFGKINEQVYWAMMVDSDRYWNERAAIYSSLSVAVDGARMRVFEPAFFTNPVVQGVIRTLFAQGAHGLSGDSPMRRAQGVITDSHPQPRVPPQYTNGHAPAPQLPSGQHAIAPLPQPPRRPPTVTQPSQPPRPPTIAQPAQRSVSPVKLATPVAVAATPRPAPAPQVPTNITQPDLRPQPTSAARHKSVNISSTSSRPSSSNIASPATAPPKQPLTLRPSASIAGSSSRGVSPGPRPVAPTSAGNSSQLSLVKAPTAFPQDPTSASPTTNGHALDSAVSADQAPKGGAGRSQPPTPQRPTWATINSPTVPVAPPADAQEPAAGPSRSSPIANPATVGPPPAPVAAMRCVHCQHTSHVSAQCPDKPQPRQIWETLAQETALLTQRVQAGTISEAERAARQARIEDLQQQLQRYLGSLPGQHDIHGPGGLAARPSVSPSRQTIEGSSKDHAIAIDDDDDIDDQSAPMPAPDPSTTATAVRQPAQPIAAPAAAPPARPSPQPTAHSNGHVRPSAPIPNADTAPSHPFSYRPPTQSSSHPPRPPTGHNGVRANGVAGSSTQGRTRPVSHAQSIFAPAPPHPHASTSRPPARPAAPAPPPKRRGCPVCQQPDQHPLQNCPTVRAGPSSVREAVARMPANHPARQLLESALGTVQNRQAQTAPAAAPAPSRPATVPATPTPAPRVPKCAMCRQPCGRTVKACAEAHGGRKALKDRIRKLDSERDMTQSASPALQSLYDCYKAWPREEDIETPRKKVKRER